MSIYFDIVSTCDIFIETHLPTRHGELSSSSNQCFPLTDNIPYDLGRYVKFLDYIRDEAGQVIGAKFLCDEGENYYYRHRTEEVDAYPDGKSVAFSHSWSSVDDDGYPEDNSVLVSFRLEWHKEA